MISMISRFNGLHGEGPIYIQHFKVGEIIGVYYHNVNVICSWIHLT